jgi:uncharacterized repeat protein (TIGR03803 family)
VATPVFFPGTGTYSSAQTVTILSATPGASIRFTTDGSTPTETVGTLYSGPVLIGANATLQAIAYASGLTTSPVNSGSYAFGSQVAAPAFTPAAGTYIFAQTVAISTTTSGAAIRYTTDGSTPSETVGTIYSGPVGIANTTVLNAIAYASGFIDSPVTDSVYTINPLNVLYNFTTSNNGGLQAGASLVQGNDGNFYGSTLQGGSGGCGTIFKITPAGVFTALAALNGANGNEPESALVQGSDGNFYGTTLYGGSGGTLGDGTVFKMTPAGVLTTLISFSGADGANPYGGLVQGSDGNFYGTTENGGSASDGTVFKITSAGVLTTLVSFDGANGAQPEATLVRGSDGNFYGTTQYGGSGSGKDGTVFKITPAGVLTTLVSFPGSAGNWPEGALPFAPLVQGSDGNFYGTTTYGGSNDFGTVFKMTPAGVLTTLVSFDNVNGAYPFAGLLQGRDGNFYGTTDGSGNDGNIFKITPAGVLTTLVSFTGGDAQFGEGPSGLVQGNDGNCYGVTTWGGSSDNGEIYQLLLPSQLPQAAAPVFSPAAGTYSSAQMVTITSATSGAAIRYTTDGSTPTETNGTLYSGPVSIGTTTTLQAIAYETGFTDSGVTSGLYTIGSGSITVSSSTGFDNIPMSSAQSGAFTASFDASPSLSPSNATMALCKGAQTAYTGLSCIARFNTSGDIDAYNGSSGYQAASVIPFSKGLTYHFRMVVNVPVSTYSVYVTPPGSSEVLVGSNYGFRKAATSLDTWDIDVNKSPGGSVTVSNLSVSGSGGTVAAPSFSPPAGTYTSAQAVIINDSTSGASIRYTTDGVTTPTETVGTLYTGSISIGTTTTLKAIAYESGMTDSTVTSGQYTISTPQVAAPSFSPAAGTYTSVQTVTITTTTSGASIRYTTDGVTTPTETVGTLYTGSISIGTTTTLKTIAYESGMTDSTVTTGLYTINQPQVVAPVFSPVAGTYTTAQTVTISTTTSGASIRYTTDGSAPSETAGTLYTGSISISTTTTLKAIAYKTGMTDSTVTTGLYTISTTSQVAAPAFSPGAGTYTSAQAVKITTTTSGASIRYTIDGSTPSETAGTLYSGPVSISTTTTLKAIGYETGFIDSSVTSGLYTINPTTRSLTGTSSNGFHALALTVAQTGTFTATFDATPSVSPENAVVGLSKGVATAYGNLSCIARFNPSGQIDAYSGTGYITSTIPYSAGVTYHFSMVVNVSAHTYSVYVTPAGKSQLTVGTNLAFRSTANAVTSLDTWNLDVNATPSGCSLTANNLNP